MSSIVIIFKGQKAESTEGAAAVPWLLHQFWLSKQKQGLAWVQAQKLHFQEETMPNALSGRTESWKEIFRLGTPMATEQRLLTWPTWSHSASSWLSSKFCIFKARHSPGWGNGKLQMQLHFSCHFSWKTFLQIYIINAVLNKNWNFKKNKIRWLSYGE